MPWVKYQLEVPQLVDVNGSPAVSYSINAYVWDTSTPLAMATDSAGSGQATSFEFNSSGKPQTSGGTAVDIFLDSSKVYKFIYEDADGVALDPTIGPVYPIGNGEKVSLSSVEALYSNDHSNLDYVETVAFAEGGSKGGLNWVKGSSGGTQTTTGTLIADLAAGYVVDAGGNYWHWTPAQVIDASAAGLLTDGSDNSAKLQAMLDQGYVVDFTRCHGTYKFDSGLAVWKVGTGIVNFAQAGARWNVVHDSAVTFEFDDAITGYALTIGGRNGSGATSSGFYNVEDFLIQGIHLRPESSGGAAGGILFDGSDTDATYGAERGICRGGTLKGVTTKGFAGKQYNLIGNVFDIKMYDCFGRQGLDTIFETETTTVNVGVTRPGQIDCFACGFFGPDRGDAGVASDAWAVRASYTNFYGGHIQGQFLAELGFHAGVYGTHMEADPGATNNDAVQIVGKSVRFYPENLNAGVTASSVALRIGDGTSTSVAGYEGHIPLIQDAATGILVTDGGGRNGHITVGTTQGRAIRLLLDAGTVSMFSW